jgi:hypothetical protein
VGTNAQQISGIKADKIRVVPLELDIKKTWKIFRSSTLVVSVMALNGNFGFECPPTARSRGACCRLRTDPFWDGMTMSRKRALVEDAGIER